MWSGTSCLQKWTQDENVFVIKHDLNNRKAVMSTYPAIQCSLEFESVYLWVVCWFLINSFFSTSFILYFFHPPLLFLWMQSQKGNDSQKKCMEAHSLNKEFLSDFYIFTSLLSEWAVAQLGWCRSFHRLDWRGQLGGRFGCCFRLTVREGDDLSL